jgi:hypothetical protein
MLCSAGVDTILEGPSNFLQTDGGGRVQEGDSGPTAVYSATSALSATARCLLRLERYTRIQTFLGGDLCATILWLDFRTV